jgi:hypothetical protein
MNGQQETYAELGRLRVLVHAYARRADLAIAAIRRLRQRIANTELASPPLTHADVQSILRQLDAIADVLDAVEERSGA